MESLLSSVLCRVYIFLAILSASATAAVIQQEDAGVGEPNSTGSGGKLVNVMMNDHAPIDISVPSDGSLAYVYLDQLTDVTAATVHSDIAATCFFWRYRKDYGANGDISFRTTSGTFSSGPRSPNDILIPRDGWLSVFSDAERLYCFDSTREDADGDTFTLFFETEEKAAGAVETSEAASVRGGVEEEEEDVERLDRNIRGANQVGRLVRLRVGEDEDYAELPQEIFASYADLLIGTKAALIDLPRRRMTEAEIAEADPGDENLKAFYGGCYFRAAVLLPEQYIFLMDEDNDIHFNPDVRVDRFACFRRKRDYETVNRWLREPYDGKID